MNAYGNWGGCNAMYSSKRDNRAQSHWPLTCYRGPQVVGGGGAKLAIS